MTTYAELCSGYGGLGRAVEKVFNATPLWFSEYEADPSRVLAHHWPTVPNLGDMTRIDWAAAPRPKILSGGTPCQDLSAAGSRAGMTKGTRSNLWVQMREAIATLQPDWVVWENVRGSFSARASSSMESGPGCVGGCGGSSDDVPVLRALGRVLGDLSDLGYDTEWRLVRASDLGACHHRARVFVLARKASADTNDSGLENYGPRGFEPAPTPAKVGRHLPTPNAAVSNDGEGIVTWRARRDAAGAHTGMPLSIAVQTLPTPGANLGKNGGLQHPDKRRAGGHQPSIEDVAVFVLPTPRATRGGSHTETANLLAATGSNWGEYEETIRRHEAWLGREAPAPTQPSPRTGKPQLAPRFVEWMMGLPDGHVTAPKIWEGSGKTPSGVRNAQLTMLGNGVVQQQAAWALADMVHAFTHEKRTAA